MGNKGKKKRNKARCIEGGFSFRKKFVKFRCNRVLPQLKPRRLRIPLRDQSKIAQTSAMSSLQKPNRKMEQRRQE